jgi:chromate transporter
LSTAAATALAFGPAGLSPAELAWLAGHFTLLSLLAVGGAMATAPDMQRFVVGERGWLTDAQFTASVALAQAAPGPNVLFVAVVGLNVAGLAGAAAALAGSLLPSAALALAAGRYGARHRQARAVRAFGAGLAPLVLAMMAATGWVLLEPVRASPAAWALAVASAAVMVRTKLNPMWLVGAGAVLGAVGLV